MKIRRWMKSVLATAKSPEMASTALPWQRSTRRSASADRSRTGLKLARKA